MTALSNFCRLTVLVPIIILLLSSCATQQPAARMARSTVLSDSSLRSAHLGITVFDPSNGKYLFDHNGGSYFVPASNMKIITCYFAMKYLGDSLAGIRYAALPNGWLLFPTGDPTFLHPSYNRQPIVDFLKNISGPVYINNTQWQSAAYGSGWSWDDYNFAYMSERSSLPVYGNNIEWVQEFDSTKPSHEEAEPSPLVYSIPEVNWKVRFSADTSTKQFYVQRAKDENLFVITEGKETKKSQWVPFVTRGIESALELLRDTIGKEISGTEKKLPAGVELKTLYSQPLDSVLKPLMVHSDNFFAEQLLLMISQQQLGYFNDEKIIDTLIRKDLKDLPQKPVWADGSGLSRYNLFSPRDFVAVLNKMKEEFGMDRLKQLFPAGGSGTLSNYYKKGGQYLFAKTGSLSGVIALSGFLYTRQNKLLLFSVLINNYNGGATAARRKVEQFLESIRDKY